MPTSLGPAEILVILVVALIVLGPKRLPEAGRQVGKALAEVRRWTSEAKSEIQSVIDVETPKKSTVVEPVVVSGTTTSVTATADPPASTVVDPVTISAAEPAIPVATEPPMPAEPATEPAAVAEPELPMAVEPATKPAAVAESELPDELPESPSGDPARL